MKKILTILVMTATLFLATSCGSALHDGADMAIGSITVSDLPESMEGKTVEFMGFWNGGTSATTPNAKITGGSVTLTFATPSIQAGETFEFKIKPIDEDGGWDWAIGSKLRLGGADVDNVKISNSMTGPSVVKKISGVVNADNTVTWSVID